MRLPLCLCYLLISALALAAPAAAKKPATTPTEMLCQPAIEAAERGSIIPPRLLGAIGQIESGRLDSKTGVWRPWPWTINAEGQGLFYDSKAQAIDAVRALQARGVQSIDVGCMQVNLLHHPTAFTSLEQAFDPQANAAYAARFLTQLHSATGDWVKATALYHSATPELGAQYEHRVMAVWPAAKQPQPDAAVGPATALSAAWAATLASDHPKRIAVLLPMNAADDIRMVSLTPAVRTDPNAAISSSLLRHPQRRAKAGG